MQTRKSLFYDNTLRDGEQHPGVYFTKKEKVEIVKLLSKLGVNFINAGSPANSEYEKDTVSYLVKKFPKIHFSALARCKHSDIDLVAATGVKIVSLFFPGSLLLRKIKFPKLRERGALKITQESIKYAKKLNLEVIFGLEDHFNILY